ncbi:MAG: DUF885 domain-containing protein [Xanthomonadales bacterium]|nr:DUF885 domain-containing protein [Xanthomonadales bacterium]
MLLLVSALPALAMAQGAAVPATPDWVQRSNEIAYQLLESGARFAPEFAGQTGVSGYDEEIFDLQPKLFERQVQASRDNLAMLEGLLEHEADPRVRQDIEIMIENVRDNIESATVNYEHVLPYGNITGLIFAGFRGLLDKQVPLERQQAALVRLRKYTGREPGYEPLTELARQRLTDRMGVDGLIRPYVGEVQQDIERAPVLLGGLQEVFAASELEGWEEDLAVLTAQLTEHNEWVKNTILPIARESAVLPRELYELALKNWGVDASPEELIVTGQVAFMNIRNELMALAPLVAAERGYTSSDYRHVLRELKKEQIHGEALMPAYKEIMRELDVIIEREGLATLPNEPARVRMASAAETAQSPAAHLDIPRLVGNTGEYPEFIVPQIAQNDDGTWPESDYAFPAMMWSLSAHEARPGHEMQFTTMLRNGVSTARALFAFNSANVEGWALYAEAITKPYMPLEGQMYSLQMRLLRAARIWLDPMLNLGLTSPEEVKRVLMEEVIEDETSAQNEVDRYTFRIPGQATAYYYGYEKLQALRAETEMRLKSRFDARAFHDFILAQGLLPPDVLRNAVQQEFIQPRLTSD